MCSLSDIWSPAMSPSRLRPSLKGLLAEMPASKTGHFGGPLLARKAEFKENVKLLDAGGSIEWKPQRAAQELQSADLDRHFLFESFPLSVTFPNPAFHCTLYDVPEFPRSPNYIKLSYTSR
jgi:hypothetical protein